LVGRRVTRLLEAQGRTIEAQLQELDRRNRELDAFASRVAHDLVSPLAPLKGYLTLIRRSGGVSDSQAQEMLAAAEASAGRMAELVEALLRFCRAGQKTDATPGALDTAVATVLLELDQIARRDGVQLHRELDEGLWVACPQQLLQSIAQNLVSNALKYSAGRPEPRVEVVARREGGHGLLEVSDNGPGMSGSSLQFLFQPFFRAPETRSLPGHGLGLATTKRLVEAHGGTIEVRSTPGAGTRVRVRLLLAPGERARTKVELARAS
jgi:signal transduction histidine kinase